MRCVGKCGCPPVPCTPLDRIWLCLSRAFALPRAALRMPCWCLFKFTPTHFVQFWLFRQEVRPTDIPCKSKTVRKRVRSHPFVLPFLSHISLYTSIVVMDFLKFCSAMLEFAVQLVPLVLQHAPAFCSAPSPTCTAVLASVAVVLTCRAPCQIYTINTKP
jgi:hypothetical protein